MIDFALFCHAMFSIGGCVVCVNLSFSLQAIDDITIIF